MLHQNREAVRSFIYTVIISEYTLRNTSHHALKDPCIVRNSSRFGLLLSATEQPTDVATHPFRTVRRGASCR